MVDVALRQVGSSLLCTRWPSFPHAGPAKTVVFNFYCMARVSIHDIHPILPA